MFVALFPLKFSFPRASSQDADHILSTPQDYNQHLCTGELNAVHFWERSKTTKHCSENFKLQRTEEQVSPSTRFSPHVTDFSRQQWSTLGVVSTLAFRQGYLEKLYSRKITNQVLQISIFKSNESTKTGEK